jgi:rhodanese-related sulfurtransferase
MNKNYLFLAILMIILAGGLLILPERTNYTQINPEDLLWDIIQPSRYVTTDQVAKMLIEQDPTLELIDVRCAKEYNKFALPNAINIPLDSILSPDYSDYLCIEDMNAIFYCNDDILADQAWVIAKRMDIPRIYILKGGLNCWIKTIIQPTPPPETASGDEFDQYDFRKGASMYFTGASISTPKSDSKSQVTIKRKKKTKATAGGC